MRVLTCVFPVALLTSMVSAYVVTPHKGVQKHHGKSKEDAKENALMSRSARAINKQEHKFEADKAKKLDSWKKIWGIPEPTVPQQPLMASKAVSTKSKEAYPPFGFPAYPAYGRFKPNPIAPLATAMTVAAVADLVKPKKPDAKPEVSKSSMAAPQMSAPQMSGPMPMAPSAPEMLAPQAADGAINDQELRMQSISKQQQWMNWWGSLPLEKQKELRLQMAWNYAAKGQNGANPVFPPAPGATVGSTVPGFYGGVTGGIN